MQPIDFDTSHPTSLNQPIGHRRVFMLAFIVTALVALMVSRSVSAAKTCSVVEVKETLTKKPDPSEFWKTFSAALVGDNCSSIKTILGMLSGNDVQGGRRLEPPRPLDVAVADAQLKAARQDPEYAATLARALQGVDSEVTRLAREAALLDTFEYYKARDLLVQRLRELQRGK